MENKAIRDFVLSVLDDDHGISETSWSLLQDLLQGAGEMEFIGELAKIVNATDGRFYIKCGLSPAQAHDVFDLPDEDDITGYPV